MEDQFVPVGQRDKSSTIRGNQLNSDSSPFDMRNQNFNNPPSAYPGKFGHNVGSFPGAPGVTS